MKCSSRRNCNRSIHDIRCNTGCLNEVQLPKELQLRCSNALEYRSTKASMKCSSRRNCNEGIKQIASGVWKPQ